MKNLELIFLRTSLLIIAAALLGGCETASSNYQKGAGTSANLQQTADSISTGKGRMEVVMAALNNLTGNSQSSLESRFTTFSNALGNLETSAAQIKSGYEAMRDGGNDYLKAWEEQLAAINNEDLRSRSAERKEDIQQKLTAIKRNYLEASIAFTPFMSDLKDVQAVLSTDLTAGGIDSIRETAERLSASGGELVTQLETLAGQFRDLGVTMSAATPNGSN